MDPVARQNLLGFESRAYGGSFLSRGMLHLSDAQYHAASVWAPLPVCFALVAASY